VLSTNTLYRTFRLMIRLSTMDEILLNAQRQGRISFCEFFLNCFGSIRLAQAGSFLTLTCAL
jgi:TPP-dependent pyruvate/acetoin dehydrogenase alpha subunit